MTRFLLAAGVHLGGHVRKVRKISKGILGEQNTARAVEKAGVFIIGLSVMN